MTQKELKRVEVITRLEGRGLKTRKASQLLGLSERKVKRLRKAYREKGAAGLVHGNREKVPPQRTAQVIGHRSEY